MEEFGILIYARSVWDLNTLMVHDFKPPMEIAFVREQCQNEFKGLGCMKMESVCQLCVVSSLCSQE